MECERKYRPVPEDISGIELEPEVLACVDSLAKNVHEAWAKRRMDEGWRYGERRDDAALTHPCLVPYSSLSENERAYDRLTVEQTLKMAVKLGCAIRMKSQAEPY